MKSGGAQVLRQFVLGFENDNGNAALRKAQSRNQPGRAGADDNDGIACHGGIQRSIRIRSWAMRSGPL